MKDKNNALQEYENADTDKSKKNKGKIKLAGYISIVSIIVLLLYRLSMAFDPVLSSILGFNVFPVVICIYMIALTVLVVVYMIYNRGFSRRGITIDMLPDTWSEDKKEDFIENGERRLRDSKWMLVLIVAFLITFLVDALELFVISRFL